MALICVLLQERGGAGRPVNPLDPCLCSLLCLQSLPTHAFEWFFQARGTSTPPLLYQVSFVAMDAVDNMPSAPQFSLPAQDAPSLSSVITVGSILLQGDWLKPALFGAIMILMLLAAVVALSLRCASGGVSREILRLRSLVLQLQTQLESLQAPAQDGSAASDSQGIPEQTLMCVDAKLLQLGQESSRIHQMVTTLQDQMSDNRHLDQLVELASKVSENTFQTLESLKHYEKFHKQCLEKVQEIPVVHRLLQALGLDLKKGFQLLETHADSHLKQQREALHLLQADNKAQSEKLAKLETSTDEAKASDKQLSVDLHVCKETLRGKIETLHSEHKRFEGSTNSNFRGINPVVPGFKHLGDQMKDMLDYLVKANQHNMMQQESMRTTMESTGNSEDRIVRVESLCAGLIDQLNEVNEVVQQVREAQQLQQEQLTTIVERTPKLPKRSPPQETPPQTTTPPAATSQAQPAPQSAPVTLEPSPPTIRLSDHLQPLVRDHGRPVIMVGDALNQPLNQFSTQDLLRALVNRGTF